MHGLSGQRARRTRTAQRSSVTEHGVSACSLGHGVTRVTRVTRARLPAGAVTHRGACRSPPVTWVFSSVFVGAHRFRIDLFLAILATF